nr:MAG TPA: hypothetical protein [Bacteriophage sp.]
MCDASHGTWDKILRLCGLLHYMNLEQLLQVMWSVTLNANVTGEV